MWLLVCRFVLVSQFSVAQKLKTGLPSETVILTILSVGYNSSSLGMCGQQCTEAWVCLGATADARAVPGAIWFSHMSRVNIAFTEKGHFVEIISRL